MEFEIEQRTGAEHGERTTRAAVTAAMATAIGSGRRASARSI